MNDDSDDEDRLPGSGDEDDQPFINHPFRVRENAPIKMNIRVCYSRLYYPIIAILIQSCDVDV